MGKVPLTHPVNLKPEAAKGELKTRLSNVKVDRNKTIRENPKTVCMTPAKNDVQRDGRCYQSSHHQEHDGLHRAACLAVARYRSRNKENVRDDQRILIRMREK